ncbi:PREDICTED: putative uncharacterized transmembrane protein DDB_G0292500 isoform X2 [Rhagoletis zephyria]|uniref:putative uncharacterized transmembrane protein DDB_G0292500 isoform X2 n=1 Tax=Rhagoletis zephyria TaxID=28612 RepID=UPI00081178B8|nr:PREDICTED: putative uncharacterized transmembrane protein DDB_G0292500 isoform X2 [Rhagoletis zephyria]
MRPFGNDITNIANNNGNGNGGGNNNNNSNNNNNNNNNNNLNGIGTGNEHNGGVHITDDPRVPPHIARMGGIVTCSPIAGRGVIRVVGRCEDAKENNMLG